MISTDIKSKLKETISDFYTWSQSPHAAKSTHTYDELKGIFLNKLKSNIRATANYAVYTRAIHDIIGIGNINFEIINGKIKNLVFTMTNGHNVTQEKLITDLNNATSELDLVHIERKHNFASTFKDEANYIINNLNNFKIPELI